MAVRNLLIRGGADFSSMYQGLNQAQRRMTTFQRSIDGIMGKVAATFASIKIGETIKNSVQDAMSVETSIENLNRTLQNSSEAFQQWANSQAQAYGMSTKEAYKYGSTYSNLISSFQSDTSQLANSTQELMKVTAIVSSKTGRTFEDTAERIRSGLLGSTEAIEDLGIYTNVSLLESTEAFARFANGKSWRQLDFQTQQQIRLTAILEQAYARYGDTLADTTQSRHNQFIASLNNVRLALGQAFLPIYNAVLPPLTALMNKLSGAISVIGAFTTAIFGKPKNAKEQTKATTGLSNSVSGLSDAASSANNSLNKASNATKKAGTAAKKAKKEIGGLIGGLDEINNLSVSTTAGTSGTEGSSGGSTDTSTPTISGLGDVGTIDMGETIDTSGLEAKVEKVKAVFDRIKGFVEEHKDVIISIIAGIVAALGFLMTKKWGKIVKVFAEHFPFLSKIFSGLGKLILNPISLIKTLAKGLAAINPVTAAIAIVIGAVVASLVYLWRTNKDFKDNVIKTWNMIKDALQPWIEAFCIWFKTLAEILGPILGGAFKLIAKIVVKVVEIWANSYLKLFQILAPIIKKLGELFLKFVKFLQKSWNKIKKFKLKEWITKKVQQVKEGFKLIIARFTDLKNDIKEKWDDIINTVKDFVINIVSKVEDFKDKVVELYEGAKDWVKDKIIEIGTKVLDFCKAVQEKWDEVKTWIKDKALEIAAKFSDTKEKLKAKWDEITGNIKDKTANMKAAVATKWSDLKTKWNDATVNIKAKTADMKAKVASKWSDLKTSWNNLTNNFKSKTVDFKVKLATAVGNIKNFVNDIIKEVNNKLIAKLSFSFTAPKWLGGKTWKWSAPQIPYLAKGGIVDNPTLAMVGEAGKEVVMPLENNTGWITDLAGKISTRMGDSGYSNPVNAQPQEVYNGDVVINLDGNAVFRQPIVSILRQLKRQGITI